MTDLVCQHCQKPIRVGQVLQPGTGVQCPYCQKVFVFTGAASELATAPGAAGEPAPTKSGKNAASKSGKNAVSTPQSAAAPVPVPAPASVPVPAPASVPVPAPASVPAPAPPAAPVTLTCTSCAKPIQVPAIQPGTAVKCPYCGAVFTYSGPAPTRPSAAVPVPVSPVPVPVSPVPVPVPVSPVPVPVPVSPVPVPVPVSPVPVPVPVSSAPPPPPSAPKEDSLVRASAVLSRPTRAAMSAATSRYTTLTRQQQNQSAATAVIVGVVLVLVVSTIIGIGFIFSGTSDDKPAHKDSKEKDKDRSRDRDSRPGDSAVRDSGPTPPMMASVKLGYFSNPDLSHPADPTADPAIKVADVVLQKAEFDEVSGGMKNSSHIFGTVRYEGSEPALETIELVAYRHVRTAGGQWERIQASSKVVVPVVPAKTTIRFKLICKFNQAEMQNYSVLPLNPSLGGGRTRWVALRPCPVDKIQVDQVGETGLNFGGFVTNDTNKTITVARVRIELYDIRGDYLGLVGADREFDGSGVPWGPKQTIEFNTTSRLKFQELGPRMEIRAIGQAQ